MDLVQRPHGRNEPWDQMTKQAARDLAAGKPTGRIGYYRPRITIKDNTIYLIEGAGYIYPKRKDVPGERKTEMTSAER